MPTRSGSFRIFRLLGIDVYLHWSWFILAIYGIQARAHQYHSYIWNVLEYLVLFLIVLTHEFGHALACRQVGGQANQIVLWPLGGVAYVSPPQRPGAMLWSIAAGPLVNVALLPIFTVFVFCARTIGLETSLPDFYTFLVAIWFTNLVLLCFNLLPIYPLDGGQIFRSLLWFVAGRANSLMVAVCVGFLGVAGMAVAALWLQSWWFGILAAFIGMNCWGGFKQAQALSKLEKSARRPEFACPVCRESPPIGEFWRCGRCRNSFDTFLTQAVCPHCNAQYSVAACPFCHNLRPMTEWNPNHTPAAVPPAPPPVQ
jgi:Zn-dependent protease